MSSYLIKCALTWAQSKRVDAYDDPCDDCTTWVTTIIKEITCT
jgi:hypothetical protein